jgi:hypothetical protein
MRQILASALRTALCAGIVTGVVLSSAAQDDASDTPAATPSRFTDPEDGRFDVSAFLDTAYGFVPLLLPITEPAVGYGAAGAAVFIHGEPPAAGDSYVFPNIATIGALRTENGTRGYFGGHLGTWRGGRLKTLAALADVDVNLEFFGLGERLPGAGLGYSVKGEGGIAGASYRIADTQLWAGVRYTSIDTSVTLDALDLPGVSPEDYDLRLAGLTPSITLDLRDNFFTPTRGWYVAARFPRCFRQRS